MFKLLAIISVILIAFTFANAEITSVVQTGKQIVVTYTPGTISWIEQSLVLQGAKTNIKPYCTNNGSSPVTCTLPSVPACDSVRFLGFSGIGGPTFDFVFPIQCTVVA
ncbi:hypothetical protein DFA_10536 [Cavenderia fasciculata]|uniref:Transmembrane protein n=1 Tax=Cavenderia fasciculata TaxID=261658 RepID=F4QAH5_CACFS|nr:uncharacterized protein DFA_10536 [Cavenderia fasciculata]EGG15694.1 hypothetical protein DFA_10536 [Cavenderia fasciculata]|eukprot:XP_004354436.1 hypothetical protein DFA_10536 [Cavenderia fasciculata]